MNFSNFYKTYVRYICKFMQFRGFRRSGRAPVSPRGPGARPYFAQPFLSQPVQNRRLRPAARGGRKGRPSPSPRCSSEPYAIPPPAGHPTFGPPQGRGVWANAAGAERANSGSVGMCHMRGVGEGGCRVRSAHDRPQTGERRVAPGSAGSAQPRTGYAGRLEASGPRRPPLKGRRALSGPSAMGTGVHVPGKNTKSESLHASG